MGHSKKALFKLSFFSPQNHWMQVSCLFLSPGESIKSRSQSWMDESTCRRREGLLQLRPGSDVTKPNSSTHRPALLPVAARLWSEQGKTCWKMISHAYILTINSPTNPLDCSILAASPSVFCCRTQNHTLVWFLLRLQDVRTFNMHQNVSTLSNSNVHMCKRGWPVQTQVLLLTSYLHVCNLHIPSGFPSRHKRLPFTMQHKTPLEQHNRSRTYPSDVQSPSVHITPSHNDLTQVSIVASCDTLHFSSTSVCLTASDDRLI